MFILFSVFTKYYDFGSEPQDFIILGNSRAIRTRLAQHSETYGSWVTENGFYGKGLI